MLPPPPSPEAHRCRAFTNGSRLTSTRVSSWVEQGPKRSACLRIGLPGSGPFKEAVLFLLMRVGRGWFWNEGVYQKRCARGACAVRVLGLFRGPFRLIWRLLCPVGGPKTFRICVCPPFCLCHGVLCNVPFLADVYFVLFRPVAALVACEPARGGPHVLPHLLPQRPPPRDSVCNCFKGRPFPGEVVHIPDAVRELPPKRVSRGAPPRSNPTPWAAEFQTEFRVRATPNYALGKEAHASPGVDGGKSDAEVRMTCPPPRGPTRWHSPVTCAESAQRRGCVATSGDERRPEAGRPVPPPPQAGLHSPTRLWGEGTGGPRTRVCV